MRKFKKALDELIEVNPEGKDFLCSLDFTKYALKLGHKYKGYGIVCSSQVPKDGIYFIRYEFE